MRDEDSLEGTLGPLHAVKLSTSVGSEHDTKMHDDVSKLRKRAMSKDIALK